MNYAKKWGEIVKGLISVIVPVYNSEDYLEKCIESILHQTYQNVEILIVNDGSAQKCTDKLNQLAHLNDSIKVYHLSKSKGAGFARNHGITNANGEFVYFLDSDDYLPEKTLEMLINNIQDYCIIRGKIKKTTFANSLAVILEGLSKLSHYTDNKYNLLNNKSALNTLIRRDFILKEQLKFSEQVNLYSDLGFIVPAFNKCEVVPYLKEAIYFKRKRNDPISNPSLNQSDDYYKIKDYIHIYNKLKDSSNDEALNTYIDKQFLNFYRKNIVTYFKEYRSIDNFYNSLHKTFIRLNHDLVNEHSTVLKREANVLINGTIKQYKRINVQHQFLRELKSAVKTKKKFYTFLYRKVFMKTKMKKDFVFFESFLGKAYSDNPKYIYEYMLHNKMRYKYVWSVLEKKDIPGDPIQVKRFSLRYFYYLAKSKYWVSNSRLPKYLNKRDGNIYLQTWHGTPLKTLVFDIKDIYSADPNYKSNFYIQSRRWDYLNSPNRYSSKIFRSAFKYDKQMLEYGYPRNDILYQRNSYDAIKEIKERLGLSINKKVILYAPTWRDDEFFSRGNYKFTLKLELDKMQAKLASDYIILLRTHYHIANQLDVSEYKDFVIDFSLYDDIAELYLVSDILITDYSSVFFDYAHLKRPILFYTYDIEKYRDQLRGFYFDMEEEVPGPLLLTTDEVINAINQIKQVHANYQDKYEAFYNKYCVWDNGSAAENTVKTIFVDNE